MAGKKASKKDAKDTKKGTIAGPLDLFHPVQTVKVSPPKKGTKKGK